MDVNIFGTKNVNIRNIKLPNGRQCLDITVVSRDGTDIISLYNDGNITIKYNEL